MIMVINFWDKLFASSENMSTFKCYIFAVINATALRTDLSLILLGLFSLFVITKINK